MSDTATLLETDEAHEADDQDQLTDEQILLIEEIDGITEDMCEAYGLRDELGERTLIIPDPENKQPVSPYGETDACLDDGFYDRNFIHQMLGVLRARHEIFVHKADLPRLVRTKDRNHNVGYGWEGDDGLLTIVREKRRAWHVLTGAEHPDGDRIHLSTHDTWTEAMDAARDEARRYAPPFLRGAKVISGDKGSFSDPSYDWSQVQNLDLGQRHPPGWTFDDGD